ncbi:MAG TPA: hypothetical protein V6D20_09035 [Candidatus Obscuribacterales bacterium]
MITINFIAPVLSMISLSTLTATGVTASESCPIAESIYRDGDGRGFQLVFGPPTPGGIDHGTAVINHHQQGQLYRFKVYQSSGYGSVRLDDQNTGYPEIEGGFWITFFDQNLQSATPLFLGEETASPMYAVIADLGSYDYYRRRGEEVLIPDAIWIFDRCQ